MLGDVAVYLVVAAHPDDPDFGVAGTAARLARDGHTVHYLMCTSGDAGSEDPTIPPDDLMRVREQEQQSARRHSPPIRPAGWVRGREREQQAAGRVLGLSGVHFLRYPDGELEPSLQL